MSLPLSCFTPGKPAYHAIWRQSGNATTHETTRELKGFRKVLNNLGVLFGPDWPS